MPVCAFCSRRLQFESQFQKEEFFEDQPDVRRRARSLQVLKAFARVGPVHLPQCFARRDQAHAAADDAGIGIGNSGGRFSSTAG